MPEEAQIEVTITGDAAALAKALEDALTKAMGKSVDSMAASLRTLVNQQRSGSLTKGITKGFEKATAEIREMGVQIKKLVDITQTGFTRGFRAATDSINDMDDSLRRAETHVRGIAEDLARVRSPDDQLREYIRRAMQAEEATEKLAQTRERASRDTRLDTNMRTEVRVRQQAASTEEKILRDLTSTFRTEFAHQQNAARVSAEGITSAMKAENAERIVNTQTAAAREVAITKRSAQQRVEIIRAVVGQIRALERGIAAVFRTSASAFGKFTSGAARAVGKLGSIFSKSDAQLADGLRGPMSRRESILRSSMSRQERIIQSSVARQSIQVTRLEALSSRGIAGVVSGRSQLGSILGGGLAIGGGFAAISQLKRLATVSADFEQTMAVLDAQLGLTDRQMENVRQTSIDLGNDISLPGVSAKDAGEAISVMSKQFGSLGKAAPRAAQDAAKGVLQLARAAGVGAEDAGQVVGAAVNVFGVAAKDAVIVADQVTGALAKAAGVGFGDFALAFKQGASVFDLFQGGIGPPLETLTQFNTALAVLARNAITGSDAGTSLKQFFLQATRNAAPARAALHEVAKRAGEMGSVFFDQEGAARPLTESIDILRRGLEGMSDAQRTSTLSTIFGSDALRTANAFLKVSGKEWEKIEKSIREEGLAAKIAAAQNTGLRGAMDALGSIIDTVAIEFLPKITKPLGNLVLGFAEFLNDLRTGEGVFATLRTVLKGVALGLGSILAVKGVTEIFKFLLILARGLLTPMGLLLTVAALVGAAFTLMMENSEAFRDAVGEIVPKLQEFGEAVIEFIRDRLTDVADFIGTTVIPAIQRFVEFIATHALEGIRAFADFFRAEVIPRLQAFANFITGTVVPAVVDGLVAAFEFARDAIKSFWDVAEPILRPAVDGIIALGEAVGDLFRLEPSKGLLAIGGILAAAVGGFAVAGPVGGIVAGLGATVAAIFATGLNDELGGALAGVGEAIVNALRGPFETVKNFFADVFTLENLKNVTFEVLDVVEEIGRILGSIVSDPRLLTAVAGIAAVAAGIAVRFVEGFARGVIENIPELASLIRDALGEALNQAFDVAGIDTDIGANIVTALAIAIGGAKAISLLTAAANRLGLATGKAIGTAVAKGTTTAMTVGGAGLGGGPKGLLQGLFGLSEGAARADAGRIARAAVGEFDRNLRVLRAAGADTSRALNAFFGQGIVGGLRESRTAIGQLKSNLGDARVAGLGARDAMRQIGTAIRVLDFKGVGQGVRDLRASLAGQGRNIGAAVGVAIAGALGIAFGAQMAIESDSMADTVLGLGTILASVAGAFAVGGAPLAAITAGLGLITTLFQQNKQAAQEAKATVDTYVAALEQTGAAAQKAAAIEAVWTAIKDAGSDAQETLRTLNLNVEDFVDTLIAGGTGTDAFFGLITDIAPDMQLFVDQFKRTGDIDQFFEAIRFNAASAPLRDLQLDSEDLRAVWELLSNEGGGVAEAQRLIALRSDLAADAIDRTTEAAVGAGSESDRLNTALTNAFGTVPPTELPEAVDGLTTQLGEAKTAAEDAKEKVDILFGKALPSTLRSAMDDFIIGLQNLPSQLEGIDMSTVVGAAEVRDAAEGKAEEFLGIISEAVEKGQITTFPQFVAERDLAIAQLEELFAPDGISPIEAEVIAQFKTIVDENVSKKDFDKAVEAFRIKLKRQRRRRRQRIEERLDVALGLNFAIPPVNLQAIAVAELKRRRRAARAAEEAGLVVNVPLIVKGEVTKPPGSIPGGLGGFGLSVDELTSTFASTAITPFPVTIPVDPKFVAPPFDTQDLTNAVLGVGVGGIGGAALGAGGIAAIPIDVPIDPTLIARPLTAEDLNAAIGGALPKTGPQGFGGGTSSRGIGGGGTSIDVPVTINPQITVAGGGQGDIGIGIAATIAAGIASAAPQISAALNTAIGQALRAGGQLTALFTVTGVAAAGAFAAGLTAGTGVIVTAATAISAAAAEAANDLAPVMLLVGIAIGGSFADGVSAMAGSASSAGSSLGSSASSGASGFSLYSIGVAVGFGFVLGVLSQAAAAYAAGASLAAQAEAGARARAQVASPSKVFRNIGRDIGRGLAEGIKDSETDITSAVNTAIDEAIETAQRKMTRKVTGAGLAAGIFARTTLPSRLPGGVPNIEVQRTALAALDALQEIVDLDEERNQQADDLRQEIKETRKGLREDLKSLKEEMVAAIVTKFEKPAAGLDIFRQRVDLSGLTRQFAKAFEDLIPDLEEEKPVEGESAEEAAAREARNQASRDRRAKALARATGLNLQTAVGRDTANLFLDFGQQIRDLGVSMLESGAPIGQVIRQMQRYRDQLIQAAVDAGISRKSLQDMLRALGLTDRQLAHFGDAAHKVGENFREAAKAAREAADEAIVGLRGELKETGSTSLGAGTAAGRINRGIVTEAMDAIREFGATALEAGQPVGQVVQRMKDMRNELVTTLVSMGFNQDQIKQLVELMGLSNEQLRQFAKNLADANDAAARPPPGPPPVPGLTIGPGGRLPNQVRDIHVHVPFGDPEATALAVTNRLAFDLNAPV